MQPSLHSSGFELMEVFDRAAIDRARAALGEHVDRVARALEFPFDSTHPDLPVEHRLDAIAAHDRSCAELLCMALCTDAHRRPELRALVESPRLRAELERLMGQPVDDPTVRVRANVPGLPHRRQPWHSDVARADGSPCARIRVTAWIPLSDAHADNGTLEVVPGRRSAPLPHEQHTGRFAIEEESLGEERVVVECPAGHCVFLDRYTPHRALENRSAEARFSLVVWAKPRMEAS